MISTQGVEMTVTSEENDPFKLLGSDHLLQKYLRMLCDTVFSRKVTVMIPLTENDEVFFLCLVTDQISRRIVPIPNSGYSSESTISKTLNQSFKVTNQLRHDPCKRINNSKEITEKKGAKFRLRQDSNTCPSGRHNQLSSGASDGNYCKSQWDCRSLRGI